MDLGSQIPLIGEQNVIGGYDFEFLDKPSTGQVCSICLVAMRNPVQTTCGHRFCEECLLGTFREGNARICPQDRSPIPQEGGLFRDVAWERDILSLRVKCKRNERGCDWTEQLRHYQEHVTECRYEDVACANCNEDVQQRLLLANETSECRNRIVQCEYCQEEFEFWRTEVHEGEECTLFPLDCPQQCGEREIPREELESHIRDDCLMTLLACPYNDAGCNFSDKRVNLEAHTKGSIEDHLRKTWTQLVATKEELKKINETEDRVMEIQGQVEQFQTKQRQVETSLQTSKDKNRELELLVRKLEQDNWCLRREVNGLTNQLAKSNRSLPQRIQSEKEERESAFEKNNKEIRDLKLTVGKLQMELTELKINTVSERLKAVVEQKERSRESVENTKDKMASFVLEAPISSSLPVYPQDSQLDGGKKSIEGIKKGEPYEERSQQHQLFSLLKPL